MLRRALPAASLACLAVAGCGDSRTLPPEVARPAAPGRFHAFVFTSAGLRFRAPTGWTVAPGQPPLVAAVSSGTAMVALWRYPRSEPLPSGRPALVLARRQLLREIRRRDHDLRVIRARIVALHGERGVEIAAYEHVGGQLRRVRSLHLYAGGAEVVLDAYAPPSLFHTVDRQVFSPIGRSLRVTRAGA